MNQKQQIKQMFALLFIPDSSSLPQAILKFWSRIPLRLIPFLFFVLLFPTPSHAVDCLSLFRQGAYHSAGRCFDQKATKLGLVSNLTLTQKYNKGRYLKNAAVAYKKAAKQVYKAAKSRFLREKALRRLEQLVRGKMYENAGRKKAVQKLINDLRNKIQFARLTIQTSDLSNKMCLQGYEFKRCKRGNKWDIELRPGRYVLTITRAGAQTKTKRFSLAPRGSQTFSFKQDFSLLRIESEPSHSKIQVNGLTQGFTPKTLRLSEDSHTIWVTKPCYLRYERSIRIKMGTNRSISIQLKKDLRRKDLPSAKERQTWGWVALGGGAALLALGIISQVMVGESNTLSQEAYKQYQTLRIGGAFPTAAALQTELNRQYSEFQGQKDAAVGWQITAIAGMGMAAISFGTGIFLLATVPKSTTNPCTGR